MILSALAFSTLMFAAPDTALAYGEAQARAERYEKDPAAEQYRSTTMQPPVQAAMPGILGACTGGMSVSARPDFTLIVSFKAGRFDAVRHTSDNPAAQCIADRMGRIAWPAPPHPDFAEEIHLQLSGK